MPSKKEKRSTLVLNAFGRSWDVSNLAPHTLHSDSTATAQSPRRNSAPVRLYPDSSMISKADIEFDGIWTAPAPRPPRPSDIAVVDRIPDQVMTIQYEGSDCSSLCTVSYYSSDVSCRDKSDPTSSDNGGQSSSDIFEPSYRYDNSIFVDLASSDGKKYAKANPHQRHTGSDNSDDGGRKKAPPTIDVKRQGQSSMALKSAEDTLQAVANGRHCFFQCLGCSLELVTIEDCEAIFCSVCESISPKIPSATLPSSETLDLNKSNDEKVKSSKSEAVTIGLGLDAHDIPKPVESHSPTDLNYVN